MSKSVLDTQLTIPQVAKIMQCNEVTVRRMISRGELKAHRFGKSRIIRINESDLAKIMRPVTSLAGVVAR